MKVKWKIIKFVMDDDNNKACDVITSSNLKYDEI